MSLAPELKPKAESFVIFDDEFGISNCRFPIITHTLRAKSLEKKWAHCTIIFIRNESELLKFSNFFDEFELLV